MVGMQYLVAWDPRPRLVRLVGIQYLAAWDPRSRLVRRSAEGCWVCNT